MKTVWAVSRGEYSDYHVIAICDTRKRAKAAAKALNRDSPYENAFVEEIAYLDRDPQRVELHFRSIEIYDIGTTGNEVSTSRTGWDFNECAADLVPAKWRWVRAPYISTRGGRLKVSGTDPERVARVFSERRALILSEPAIRQKKEARGTCRRERA